MKQNILGILVIGLLGGCSAGGASSDVSTGPEQDVKGGLVVTGDKAERLVDAFSAIDAVDHAMGGRASVDVSNLSCIARANIALDETDPTYAVPITACEADVANHTPLHVTEVDAAQKAMVMFDALAAVDDSLRDAAMGKEYVGAKSIACQSTTCTVANESGKAFTVDSTKAQRIEQALGLFGATNATDVQCTKSRNEALDPTAAAFGIPSYRCTTNAISIADDATRAEALMDALTKAGLEPDAAMGGKLGVGAKRVTCTKGPSAATSCTIR